MPHFTPRFVHTLHPGCTPLLYHTDCTDLQSTRFCVMHQLLRLGHRSTRPLPCNWSEHIRSNSDPNPIVGTCTGCSYTLAVLQPNRAQCPLPNPNRLGEWHQYAGEDIGRVLQTCTQTTGSRTPTLSDVCWSMRCVRARTNALQ